MKKLLPPIAAFAAAACAAVPAEEPILEREQPGHACNASRVQDLVGRQSSQALGADALRRSGSAALRWIRPGDAVTMDFRGDRLNIDLDARGRVAALRCG